MRAVPPRRGMTSSNAARISAEEAVRRIDDKKPRRRKPLFARLRERHVQTQQLERAGRQHFAAQPVRIGAKLNGNQIM